MVAYHFSRKRTGESPITGKFGTTFFQVVVVVCTLLASVGAMIPVH